MGVVFAWLGKCAFHIHENANTAGETKGSGGEKL